MKLIKTIRYEDVKFRFISNHYDVHRNGTCIHKGKLCEFKTILHFDDIIEDIVDMVDIYELNLIERSKWIYRQWLFELCVGKHWSYKNGKKQGEYHIRNPKWLYERLGKLYYKLK